MEDLELEIFELIGKSVADDRILAPAIPNRIAVWLEIILKKGIPENEKEQLIKDHVSPENCFCFNRSKLNEEIKVLLNETSSKRDERLVEKQKKITFYLVLLGSIIVDVINDNKLNGIAQKLSTTQASLLRKLSEASGYTTVGRFTKRTKAARAASSPYSLHTDLFSNFCRIYFFFKYKFLGYRFFLKFVKFSFL